MNFIEKYDNALSKEQCTQIIDIFEEHSTLQTPGVAGGVVDHSKKKSMCLNFTFEPTGMQHKDKILNDMLGPALYQGVERYKKKYRYLDNITTWRLNRDYHMQRMEKDDGYFAIHCEQEGPTSKRILTWMFYLNDARCGTKFYYQNRTIKPRQGRLLIWPAGWTHMHSGVVPNIDRKYIITGWYSFA